MYLNIQFHDGTRESYDIGGDLESVFIDNGCLVFCPRHDLQQVWPLMHIRTFRVSKAMESPPV